MTTTSSHVATLGSSSICCMDGWKESQVSRRSCRQRINRIRLHRSYTMKELSSLLRVHVRTIQQWHKEGLQPITEQDRPMLFIGSVARAFLKKRQKERKCELQPTELYCLRCRTGVTPVAESIDVKVTNRMVSKDALGVEIRGKCPTCDANIVRFASSKSIRNTIWSTMLPQAEKRLIGTAGASLSTDLEQE